MGNDNAIEAVDVAANGGKAPQRFLFAKARVNQKPGRIRFEQRAVARTARSKNGDAQTDKFPRRMYAHARKPNE
jgi:hypothetical protein